jgi:hypothetical protein
LPKGCINIYGFFDNIPVKDAIESHIGQTNISSFSIGEREIEGFKLSSGGNATSREFNLKWCPKSEPIYGIGNESTEISYLIFHLFNFVDFSGSRISIEKNGSSDQKIEHLDLICNEWNIEIKSLFSSKESFDELKENGGYRLTHIGSIVKKDGTVFKGENAISCLTALSIFLSFAKGAWCTPICVVGFDSAGNRVWESWSSPNETWYAPLSWFDARNVGQLTTLFHDFMEKWRDSYWSKAFHEVIYWYLNANFSSRGIDAGIILTQAAIERLSYEYAVKSKKLVTANGFKDLWASDKFRLLFSSLNIPIEIPNDTPELEALSQNVKWLDAPHALTEIRNSLVHPEHKRRGQFAGAYYEAWNLGLWYLEMGLLAICGYTGTYGNRLKKRWVGQVDTVPWAKQ